MARQIVTYFTDASDLIEASFFFAGKNGASSGGCQMNTVQVVRIMDRDQAIAGLAKLRSEWEDASNGRSLFDIKAYVGFMLIDIANAIGLTVEEQVQALGDLPQHVH